MINIVRVAFTVFFALLMGCDSADTSTYSFTGTWNFSRDGSPVCSQVIYAGDIGEALIEFSTIEVSVFNKETDEDPLQTVSVPCKDKSFKVEGLARGSYFVRVEAIAEDPDVTVTDTEGLDAGLDTAEDDAPESRAYYVGSETVVLPTANDDIIVFELGVNKGTIEVTWDFEAGLNCGSSDVKVDKVTLELTGTSSINNESSGKLDCDIEGQKYLFEGLAWDYYSVTVTGYDASGAEKYEGSFETPVEIKPGTNISGRDGVVVLYEIDP